MRPASLNSLTFLPPSSFASATSTTFISTSGNFFYIDFFSLLSRKLCDKKVLVCSATGPLQKRSVLVLLFDVRFRYEVILFSVQRNQICTLAQ